MPVFCTLLKVEAAAECNEGKAAVAAQQ